MAAPFKCDEKVTVEQLVGTPDPVYGTETQAWAPVLVRYWANVQDELPSRAESTKNGLDKSVLRTRLRMQGAQAVTGDMRVILHSRGDRVMQIIAGPALLDDRVHTEFQLEGYLNG
ncbi:phage head completion protein [Massilia scottii]|uniref:phage head completion protein n=1 Tax=Massilia scottii TaxID=3057166 RepID=UPI0027966027|nr:head-tail adaptor protein [Massilia sp. CCM 9029]MDQ1834659.1 head-tail adaptor protein [Massilia sp. CCM 9029]